MREVQVLPYDPEWSLRFEEEAARLRNAFGDSLVRIHHIGSTAVPGLPAKPVIDLLAEVRDIAAVDKLNDSLAASGYQARGENGIKGRRFFIKPSDDLRTHHLHVFQRGSAHVFRHLAMVDYLRDHPAEAEEYGRLKSQLAASYPLSIDLYVAGKDAYVQALEKRALEWAYREKLTFAPLTADRWEDFERLFGSHGAFGGCWCMYFFLPLREFTACQGDANREAFHARVVAGPPPGVLAYLYAEPVGWCAFGPRETYPRLARSRTMKSPDERPVWSVVCFYTARAARRRGLTTALLEEVVRQVAARGGKIVEGYPSTPGNDHSPDPYLYTGTEGAYRKAGFVEVSRPAPRRPVMRREIA